ncbi:MAG: phosphopyruvate hydratase, partial [Patescibacteria group bacterium]
DWQKFTAQVGGKLSIIGDDLFVTNVERLQKGIDLKAANAILVKPNQIGTLSETVAAIKLAQANNFKIIISHRSGETNDTTIADLSVAVGAEHIKAGAPDRGERVAKYNRLLEIERELFENNQNSKILFGD